jgi:hypothetical protein
MADEQRSTVAILVDIVRDAQDIVQAQVRMAMAEVREELFASQASARLLGIGILSAILAVVFGLIAVESALSYVVPQWAAALIVALALALCAALTLRSGSRRLQKRKSGSKTRLELQRAP